MRENIRENLRKALRKKNDDGGESLKRMNLSFFLNEQSVEDKLSTAASMQPLIDELSQTKRDVASLVKYVDNAVKALDAEGGLFLDRISDSADAFDRNVDLAIDLAKQGSKEAQSIFYAWGDKTEIEIVILTFASLLNDIGDSIEDFPIDLKEVPDDFKTGDLWDNFSWKGLALSDEEIEKIKKDETGSELNKKEKELNDAGPDAGKFEDLMDALASKADLSSYQERIKNSIDDLQEDEYVSDFQTAYSQAVDIAKQPVYLHDVIMTSNLNKLMKQGKNIASRLEDIVEKTSAQDVSSPEKLASQQSEDALQQQGINLTEPEMVDFIEKYLVQKLGIGGSADNSVGLFLKLADPRAGLLSTEDIRRLM